MKQKILTAAASVLALCCGCSSGCSAQNVRTYTFKVEEALPHDASSYTQGLFFDGGSLYESAGQYGTSSLRKVDLQSGAVLQRYDFDSRYFAEGSCIVGDKLYVLTWQEHECFVFDAATFKKLGSVRYEGEGWGLTTDGKYLIMSDGTSRLRFLDPDTFMLKKELTVTMNGKNVTYINELEYIKGEIWANLYTTDMIARIDPETGKVTGVVNCSGLLPRSLRKPSTDVLNGIAYNPSTGRLYLTGKYWPKLYRVTIKEK